MYHLTTRNSVISNSFVSPVAFFMVFVFLFLLAFWTETNMEWLFSKFAHRPIDVPYWLAAVATIFTNIFGLWFNILCELAKLIWP